MVQPKVAIILGSDSDYPVIQDMLKILTDFDISMSLRYRARTAHRTGLRNML